METRTETLSLVYCGANSECSAASIFKPLREKKNFNLAAADGILKKDVTLDAKTPELAKHYERDFGAILLPGRGNGAAPRYLICDEAARDIFTSYLKEK